MKWIGGMAETRKRWDYNTDNSLGSFTGGEHAIGSNKRNARDDSRAQQDTDNGKAKASGSTTNDTGELPVPTLR
ncbi:hypothetical protein PanWU01x14_350920 [Parasponia andersonii]|uniref:Uncharacterized protein n=1 Tax=Parasponia andersonii TaxID=3476 RepID=A0A2P5AAU3_PARAD|nr:hypothetical protein PanWU01x14_350920 [Parasponia andersonii]